MTVNKMKIPEAPSSIQKGVPLKNVLGEEAVWQLAENIKIVVPGFEFQGFIEASLKGFEPLTLKERASHLALSLKEFLPDLYSDAIAVLLKTLTPPLTKTEDLGTSGMFYMPHVSFIEQFGLDTAYNGGADPFEVSMAAQYELTRRFTAEFSIRPFVIDQSNHTFERL